MTHTIIQHHGIADGRQSHEDMLLARGVALPLSARLSWLKAFPDASSTLFVAVDASGDPVGAVAVEHSQSRLPGHVIWRVRHVDPEAPLPVTMDLVRAVVASARANRRVLRLHLDVLARRAELRASLVARLPELRFVKLPAPREHDPTLVLDLTPGAEAIWASPGLANVRKKVRVLERGNLSVRVVDDEMYEPRMREILAETYARTGGAVPNVDLGGAIRLGRMEPGASRLVGVFMPDRSGPDSLVAYVWGIRNGSHITYDVGASTSDSESRKFPLAYSTCWNLVEWGCATGATWFDLGGVTLGSKETGDILVGISDFKRHFSADVVHIREEWQMEPHPLVAGLARALSSAVAGAQRLRAWAASRRDARGAPAPSKPSDGGVDRQSDTV